MKKQRKPFLYVSLGLSLAIAMNPMNSFANQYSDYIESMSLNVEEGINPHLVVLKNVSANKHIDAINIQPQQSSIDFDFNGTVSCKADNDIAYDGARAYFGPVFLFVDTIQAPQALYNAGYNPNFTDGKGNKRITEGGNYDPFTVPLNQIKQGHPAVRFDPIEELNKKLQQHLNQGGTKLSFYQQDHFITVERTVSLAGWCKLKGTNTSKAGFASKNIHLTVKYEGDPDLKLTGTLNAQLANNAMPNQINQNLPFILNTATFQPNMPHYIGQCPPDQDPTIRINYSGAGKGVIRFQIEDNGNPIFGTTGVIYDSSVHQTAHLDFHYPLISKLAQGNVTSTEWATLNKTFNHPLTIRASFKDYKDVNNNNWGEWKTFGSATWNHRCTPKVNFNSPATLGGFKNNNGSNDPVVPGPSKIAPVQIKPTLDKIQAPTPVDPKPIPGPNRIKPVEVQPSLNKIQAPVPVSPTPVVPTATDIRAVEPEPKPTLQLKATQQ